VSWIQHLAPILQKLRISRYVTHASKTPTRFIARSPWDDFDSISWYYYVLCLYLILYFCHGYFGVYACHTGSMADGASLCLVTCHLPVSSYIYVWFSSCWLCTRFEHVLWSTSLCISSAYDSISLLVYCVVTHHPALWALWTVWTSAGALVEYQAITNIDVCQFHEMSISTIGESLP